jgi:hypothetical protein
VQPSCGEILIDAPHASGEPLCPTPWIPQLAAPSSPKQGAAGVGGDIGFLAEISATMAQNYRVPTRPIA